MVFSLHHINSICNAEGAGIRLPPFLNGTFPTVREYEIPALAADMGTVRNGTNTPYFTPPLTAKDAVYTLWIGASSNLTPSRANIDSPPSFLHKDRRNKFQTAISYPLTRKLLFQEQTTSAPMPS